MTYVVECIKLKKKAPGLMRPPYPGVRGEWVYRNVSAEAWSLWQEHQTRLINEKRLNLLDKTAQSYLFDQMEKFFKGETYDQVAGYVKE